MNYRDVILEKHNTIQNYALSLAHRMVTGYLLVQVLQMQILNMVPHVRISVEWSEDVDRNGAGLQVDRI